MDSTSNSSSPPSLNSSSMPPLHSVYVCSDYTHNTPIRLFILIVILLFLFPLFLRVLYLANVRRRTHSAATATNSDLFTIHMIVMEMACVTALTFYLIGQFLAMTLLIKICVLINTARFAGNPLFHCCTCVERYLAVVHPVKYLGLRVGGARLWHVAAGCVWLLSFGWVGIRAWYLPGFPTSLYFIFSFLCLLTITFCCLSVLRALIRPGPGDGGGAKERMDQSKLRAFWTITAILGALTLNLFVSLTLSLWNIVGGSAVCLMFTINFMFSLPSGAVQPILFLHRAGKIPGCRNREG